MHHECITLHPASVNRTLGRARSRDEGLLRLARQSFQASKNTVSCNSRATNNEDCVVPSDSPQDIRPSFTVECSCDRLSSARNCPQYYHLAHAVNTQKKLRQESLEGHPALLDRPVGNSVPRSLWSRHPRQP